MVSTSYKEVDLREMFQCNFEVRNIFENVRTKKSFFKVQSQNINKLKLFLSRVHWMSRGETVLEFLNFLWGLGTE